MDGRLSALGMCQLFLVMPPPSIARTHSSRPQLVQSQRSLLANKACSILGKPVFQIMWFWLDGQLPQPLDHHRPESMQLVIIEVKYDIVLMLHLPQVQLCDLYSKVYLSYHAAERINMCRPAINQAVSR